MFGFLHRPGSEPRGGVVICSPLLAEFRKNYRREVLLSRLLSRCGFAVQRFHYRGSGHSDGESRDMTFDSMRADALAASEHLANEVGVSRVAFLGTRLGGLVAATASELHHGAPLVLWEPILDSSQYVRDVFRWRLISNVRERAGEPSSIGALTSELGRLGFVDILGYPLHETLFESVNGLNLVDVVDTGVRPILLIQMSRSPHLRTGYEDVIAKWSSLGFPVTGHVVPQEEAWWLTADDSREDEETEIVARPVQLTKDWLSGRFPRGEIHESGPVG